MTQDAFKGRFTGKQVFEAMGIVADGQPLRWESLREESQERYNKAAATLTEATRPTPETIKAGVLTLSGYQANARPTAIYPGAGSGSIEEKMYLALGLVGEAGEVAEKVKKAFRDRAGSFSDDQQTDLAKEIGDVLWYAANLALAVGYDLGAVGLLNLAKLASRKDRQTLSGSGDNR